MRSFQLAAIFGCTDEADTAKKLWNSAPVKMTVRTREMIKHLVAAFASLGMAGAAATTLYKHVDKDGKVTYTDRPLVGGAAEKAIIIPIDQNRLAPPPPRPPAPSAPREETDYEKIIRGKPPGPTPVETELKAAQKRLADAKAAVEDEQNNARAEDWFYTRFTRFPKPEYLERLAAREADVKKAEEAVADLERKIRLQ